MIERPFDVVGLGTVLVDHFVGLPVHPEADTENPVLADHLQVGLIEDDFERERIMAAAALNCTGLGNCEALPPIPAIKLLMGSANGNFALGSHEWNSART